jgi:hypothetical protein
VSAPVEAVPLFGKARCEPSQPIWGWAWADGGIGAIVQVSGFIDPTWLVEVEADCLLE